MPLEVSSALKQGVRHLKTESKRLPRIRLKIQNYEVLIIVLMAKVVAAVRFLKSFRNGHIFFIAYIKYTISAMVIMIRNTGHPKRFTCQPRLGPQPRGVVQDRSLALRPRINVL